MSLKKVTELDGYYATGDWEAFVFDRHPGPIEHRADPSTKDTWDECRVYPNELLPEGTEGRKGRWTITIEFEPES